VVRALGGVIEPDYGRSIVSLGLIRGIHVTDRGRNVVVEMTLTSPRSPHGLDLVWAAERALRGVPGVKRAEVRLDWGVPWEAGARAPDLPRSPESSAG